MSKLRQGGALLLLAFAAFAINFYPPVIYFDMQIMLGGSLAVFALLQFGWSGLLVGICALAVTLLKWGHAFELTIGTTFLIWLKIFLDYLNGGRDRQDNGRVVLAAIAFWVVAGIPAEFLLFNRLFELDATKSFALGLKEAVTSIINTIAGFGFYLLVRIARARKYPATIPIRGAAFAVILVAVTIPAILIKIVNSHQLKQVTLEGHLEKLQQFAYDAAHQSLQGRCEDTLLALPDMTNADYRYERPDGTVVSSAPGLFELLARDYEIETKGRSGITGLDLYAIKENLPLILADRASYWTTTLEVTGDDQPGGRITVVQPSFMLIQNLDYDLLLPAFTILFVMLLLGAILSERISLWIDGQFQRVLQPSLDLRDHTTTKELGRSTVRELDEMAQLINRSNRDLRQVTSSLNLAQQAAHIGSWESDRRTGSVWWSDELYKLFDVEADVRTPMTREVLWGRLIHPDDQKVAKEVYAQAIANRQPIELEFRIITPRGTVKNIEMRGEAQYDDAGAAIFTRGTIRDITERVKAENELRALKEQVADIAYTLTRNIPVGTYVTELDDNGVPTFTFCSERWLQMLDLKREDVMADARLAFQRVHPDYLDDFIKLNERVMKSLEVFQWEGPIIVHGKTRWVSIESKPRRKSGGGSTWEGVMIDITERMLYQQKLADANRLMRMAASAAQLGFWEYDITAGRVIWDDSTCRIHGIRPSEFSGDWAKFIHQEDRERVLGQVSEFITSSRLYDISYRIVRADGEVRHVTGQGSIIRDREDRPLRVTGVLFDVTEKMAEARRTQEMEQAYREQLKSKLKSSLTASAVAHEINQPLSTLLLQTKQAIARGGANPDELQVIASEAEQVLGIIEKMKVLLRSVQTHHEKVNLRAIIDSAMLQVKRTLRSHDVSVAIEGGDQEYWVTGDDAQIQLAITNIIRNSIEAMTGENRGRERKILINLGQDNEAVRLTIGDSGPGWSGAEREENTLVTTKPQGSGIGLFIVRTTAKNHHAEVLFGSSPLGGAEITLVFPRPA